MWVVVALLGGVAAASAAAGAVALARAWRAAGIGATLALVAVTAVAGWLRYEFVPAHHAMYLDEPWYEEAACNLARSGRLELCRETWSGALCEAYAKAPGWPVLLAPLKWWSDCAAAAGIAANRLLGTASAPLVACAALLAGAAPWPAVGAAALLAAHPAHVEWSATAETNVAAAFVLLTALCAALSFLRRRSALDATLAASAFGLATAIRPESAVASLAAVAVLAVMPEARARRAAVAIAGATAAAVLASLSLWSMNEEISGGGFLSLANVAAHLTDPASVRSPRAYAALAALATLGLSVLARRSERAVALLLAAAAVGGAVVVLAYDRFAERMLLAPTLVALPAAALAARGVAGEGTARRVARLAAVAALVLVFAAACRSGLPALTAPVETQLLESRLTAGVARRTFPPEALFVLEQPSVLAAVGLRRVMRTGDALSDAERLVAEVGAGRPVFFLRDMFCEQGFGGAATPPGCARLLDRFAVSAVVEARLNVRDYALLRLSAAGATTGTK